MYQIGTEIVYPVHGAGVIEAIEERQVLGEQRNYYVLRIATSDMQVLVPVDGVEQVKLRPVCDSDKLKQVAQILQDSSFSWEDNWNRRYRQNMDKIKSGDICQVAEVVRNLTHRESSRGLSPGDKKLLDNARKILLSEVVLAAGISLDEAADGLDRYCSQPADIEF